MIKFIKNLLSCCFLPMILSVTQSQAEDIKDLKIQQLETLLQTYIEENIQLKKQLEKLSSIDLNGNNAAVENNLNACKASLSSCSDEELCKIATYEDWYKKNEFHWKRVGPGAKFSTEAKRRKLSCGVPKSNEKQSPQLSEANIGDVCLNNLNNCDPVELCKIASYKVGNKNYWSKNNSHKKYIEAAKRRNISCGVIDLERQAKKEQEEQERKELEEEMKADEEEARLAAAEAEKKRIADEKARLAAEAEKKRKEEEKIRLAAEAEEKREAKEKERLEAEAKRNEEERMGLYSMQFSAWDLGCAQNEMGPKMYCGVLRLNASQKSILEGIDKMFGGTGAFSGTSNIKARSDKNYAEIFLDLQLNKTNIRVDELGVSNLDTDVNDWTLFLIPKLDYKSLVHLPSKERQPDVWNYSFRTQGLFPVIGCNLISTEQKKEATKINKNLTYDIIGDFVGEMNIHVAGDRNNANKVLSFNNCKFFER